MDKERVIKSMRDAIEANKHIREQTNNALSHGIGLLEKQDGEYERGLNDAWELAKKISLSIINGGYDCDELDAIFGYRTTSNVYYNLTAQEALEKVKAYEKNKEEEAAKPKLGDVVIVRNPQCCFEEKGIYLTGGLEGFLYLTSNGTVVDSGGDYFTIEKTGEHVDIQGMLDKIG